MTPFEIAYTSAETFLPPLLKRVRGDLRHLVRGLGPSPRVLDVGGRKSHYTIGVPARVTISDLPRETGLQRELNLGITDEIAAQTLRRRSNVDAVIVDDMTESGIPSASFDCVVAVEVLEHVEADGRFLENVSRVLRPGGVFLMTTPNGDFVENHNPDHKRHYRREELATLLSRYFGHVRVEYAIRGGRWRRLGLVGWSVRHPVRTLLSMAGNVVNTVESSRAGVGSDPVGTHHLVAVAVRSGS